MIIDAILVVLIAGFTYGGYKAGFIKSVLGMVSVLVCGLATMVIYNYLSHAGIIARIDRIIVGTAKLQKYAAQGFSGVINYTANGLIMVVLFLIIKLLYRFIVSILNFGTPGFINNTLGAVFGFAKGGLVILVVLGIIFYVSGNQDVKPAVDAINKTSLAKELYTNNILLRIIGL